MTVLNRIAHLQGRRDEAPNQALASDLARKRDAAGIAEIAGGLRHADKQVRADCIKVLYEIGETDPDLIASYAPDFLHLLDSRDNRLVWGAATALAAIAPVAAPELFKRWQDIRRAVETGSVITQDNGVKALALVAAAKPAYAQHIVPFLLEHLAGCRPKDAPQRAEKVAAAVGPANRAAFAAVLDRRMADLSAAQAARVRKVRQP